MYAAWQKERTTKDGVGGFKVEIRSFDNRETKYAVFTRTPPPSATYVVKVGESLWSIAKAQLGDGRRFVDILRENKLKLEDSDLIRPGQKLLLPAKG
jgi:nucleoid-associated protein YgaU